MRRILSATLLPTAATASAARVGFMKHANRIGQASFQARYGRK